MQLNSGLAACFSESQIYRIDHCSLPLCSALLCRDCILTAATACEQPNTDLGKELVQNILALRFANVIFEPLWSRLYIDSIQIVFKENIGTEGRGGYFDSFGIVRDIMQNHLLQVLTLVAMEPPVNLDANAVRDEKVKVLKAIQPLKLEDLVIGQYAAISQLNLIS